MNGDPENRSESGSEAGEHRHRQLANGIKNQRITKTQYRILNRMAKFTKRMPLAEIVGVGTSPAARGVPATSRELQPLAARSPRPCTPPDAAGRTTAGIP